MIRLLIVGLLVLSAQISFAQGFGGGISAGISTSQIIGDGIHGFHKVGFYGGGFTDFRFTKKSALQFELNFIQKGSRQTPTAKNGNVKLLWNFNYVELPIVYRWYGIKNMNIEIGPQLAYMISNYREDPAGEVINDPIPYRPLDLSVTAGLSYYFLKSKKLEVNVRYATSILSVQSADWWSNQVISFSLRYWFKRAEIKANPDGDE